MKKYLLFAFSFILFAPTLVKAVSDENITKRRPDLPTQVEVQEIRQEIQNRVAQVHANRLTKRFDFYYMRFSNIITRFQTRLDILKSNGKDTPSTQAKLELVKTKLADAKTAGDAAIATLESIDPTKFSEQKSTRLAAKDQANKAVKLFIEVHTLLKDALKSLKTLTKPALPASSAAVQNAP